MKDKGLPNNLIDLIAAEPMFGLTREEIEAHLDAARYIGRCPQQVDEFLDQDIRPVLERYREEGSEPIAVDRAALKALGVDVVERPLASEESPFARHSIDRLAQAVMELYEDRAHTKIF